MKASPWLAPPGGPRWLGLDVGGANLKVADGLGRAVSRPFALWKHPEELPAALRSLIKRFDDRAAVGIAMTMTGELADCYATKADGVRDIVKATVQACDKTVRVGTADDRWLTPDQAVGEPQAVAAANWRIASRLVARNGPQGPGCWIDVGSTTTDVIPIAEGKVTCGGSTDTERLLRRELVYTGVRRTPVCAIVDRLPYAGRECPVAAEWFATAADVWLLLGELCADINNTDTADGRPFCRRGSLARLARCICADENDFTEQDALSAAARIAEVQAQAIAAALPSSIGWVVIGGEGGFLAERAVGEQQRSASLERVEKHVGSEASGCFPAHAASVLAAGEIGAVK